MTTQLSESRLGLLQRMLKLLLQDKGNFTDSITSNISAVVRFQRLQALINKVQSEIEAYGEVET